METFQQKEKTNRRATITIAERLKDLEGKVRLAEREKKSKKDTKEFKFPFKWRLKFNQTHKRPKNDMMLVFFLNKKNQMEAPKFMPIFEGNMIVYKNKPYEFDPRAVWTVTGMRGNPQAYIIKEIDRRPVRNKDGRAVYVDAAVTNQDLDEIRDRGDSTESDEFLIKAALKAQTNRHKAPINKGIIVVAGVIVIGLIIWFVSSGGS